MERNLQSRLDAAREARRPASPSPDDHRARPDRTGGDPDRPSVIDLRTLRSVREAGRRTRGDADVSAGGGAGDHPRPATGPVEQLPLWRSPPRSAVTTHLPRRTALRGETHGEPITTTRPVQERCPGCGGSVRLDVFDLVTAVAHLTCLDCGLLYTARSPRT